jgi:hypothetical protein
MTEKDKEYLYELISRYGFKNMCLGQCYKESLSPELDYEDRKMEVEEAYKDIYEFIRRLD